ncbi:MAG TPA: thioesterase [Clostridiaceae bacterium]|nr:thioesterase [Clostridiaceae bacterium]
MNKKKIFFLPYAGGSSILYYPMRSLLEKGLNLHLIDYAGHGLRYREPLCKDFDSMLNDVINQINQEITVEEEFYIFGHSLGGLLTYECIDKLNFTPRQIFISAYPAPHYKNDTSLINKSDKELISDLIERGGIDGDDKDSLELIYAFLPAIRADFEVLISYPGPKQTKNKIEANILYTSEDQYTDAIREWDKYFDKPCRYDEFQGDHYFIRREYESIAKLIRSRTSITRR